MTSVLIVLFDDVDLLDVGGPYEVLLTANRLTERDGATAPFVVTTASPDGEPVIAYGGMGLVPTADAVDGPFDVVVVPGTVDLEAVTGDAATMAFIRQITDAAALKTSVCTGSILLGRLGFLADRPWTTHWEDIESEGTGFGQPGTAGRRWVDDGDLVTAGGLSSGIAMALHLVSRLASPELATRTAKQIDYDWDPSGSRT